MLLFDYSQEEKMPLHVLQLVLDGELDVNAIWYDGFDVTFLKNYQEVMEDLKLPAIPIEFDAIKKMFRLLPAFVKKADPKELRAFRQLLQSRFEQYFQDRFVENKDVTDADSYQAMSDHMFGQGDEDEDEKAPEAEDLDAQMDKWEAEQIKKDAENENDDDSDDFEDLNSEENVERSNFLNVAMPEMPYRADNRLYVDGYVKKLMNAPDGNIMGEYRRDSELQTDDYGWIENRKELLEEEVLSLSCRYILPVFDIEYDDDNQPYFVASEDEINAMQWLLQKRVKEEKKIYEIMREYADFDKFSDSDDLEERKIYKEMTLEMNARVNTFDLQLKTKWAHENALYDFPSSTVTYPFVKVEEGFSANSELLVAANEGTRIGADAEFVMPENLPANNRDRKVTFPLNRAMLS